MADLPHESEIAKEWFRMSGEDIEDFEKRREALLRSIYSRHPGAVDEPLPVCAVDTELLINEPWFDPKAAGRLLASAGVEPIISSKTEAKRFDDAFQKSLLVLGKRRRKRHLAPKSLVWLASLLGNSPKTIRRYCEKGIVLGAFRTEGGHWRVSLSRKNVAAVRQAIADFERSPKSNRSEKEGLCESNSKAHYMKALLLARNNLFPEDVEVDYERLLYGAGLPENFFEPAALRPGSEKGIVDAVEKALPFTILMVAARRLRMKGRHPTSANLAAEIGISRRSLYRRYSSHQIKVAISGVPVDQEEEHDGKGFFNDRDKEKIEVDLDDLAKMQGVDRKTFQAVKAEKTHGKKSSASGSSAH
jgi:hypothetical protein